MDSKDLAIQTLLADLKFLRQHEGATWGRYKCTMLLHPLWNCGNVDMFENELIHAIESYVDERRIDFLHWAFGLDMFSPGLLGKRRREIAERYKISVREVAKREDAGLLELANGIVDDYPLLGGISITATEHPAGSIESARSLVRAMTYKVGSLIDELNSASALRNRLSERVGTF